MKVRTVYSSVQWEFGFALHKDRRIDGSRHWSRVRSLWFYFGSYGWHVTW